MVDRRGRDRLAELARHLADGVCTNDQFEDRASPVVEQSEGDPAMRAIFNDLSSLYSDFQEYRLRGRHRLTKDVRGGVARCMLFLHSDLEYQWPPHPYWSSWGRLAFVLLFWSLIERLTRRAVQEWRASGDFDVWPFIRRTDYEAALARPRLLAGGARHP